MPYKGYSDFRSDTVTRPTDAMKKAMMDAELGDDVLGDDPTVKKLEEMSAQLLNKEAALFVPSGTMGNTIAIKLAAGEGKGVIMEEKCHIFNFEAGNVARIAYSLPQTLPSNGGEIPLDLLESSINVALREHMPQTTAITLENTHNLWGGRILSMAHMEAVRQLAKKFHLHIHLDGARLFNAAVALNEVPAKIAAHFDSIMFCLSKGLSAPIGSMLVGSTDFIKEARTIRKSLGGGMRQVGMIAAAGIIAITRMVDRLVEDHQRARTLAEAISDLKGLDVNLEDVQTNMIRVTLNTMDSTTFLNKLGEKRVLALPFSQNSVRLVTHKDIDDTDIERSIKVIRELFLG